MAHNVKGKEGEACGLEIVKREREGQLGRRRRGQVKRALIATPNEGTFDTGFDFVVGF